MKLVTYLDHGRPRPGALVGESILDLPRAAVAIYRKRGEPSASIESVAARFGDSVLAIIERQATSMPIAREAVALAQSNDLPLHVDGQPLVRPRNGAVLLAPIPRPPSMRDGYAFRQHVATARKNRGLDMIPEFDQFPVFYFTNHQAVVGPGDVPVMPLHLDRLDFELEAAIVVGARARNVKAKDADALVFGLMAMNDFSARALQMEEMKLSLGPAKGKDFATALGPCLVTIDELADVAQQGPHGRVFDLAMRAFVNGTQWSEGNVKDMNWTFAQILERASYGVDLYPGDVIGSGTCGTGCFLELNGSKKTPPPHDTWLKVGDVVTMEIDRIGRLENRIVAEE